MSDLDIFETTRRETKCRVPTVCCECRHPIEKGVTYIKSSEKVNGRYSPLARHSDCLAAGDALDAEITHSKPQRMFLAAMIEHNPELKPRLSDVLGGFPEVLGRLL